MGGLKLWCLLAIFCQPIKINAHFKFSIGGLFNNQSDEISQLAFKQLRDKKTVFDGHYIYSDVTEDGYSTSLDVCKYTSQEDVDYRLIALIDARPSYGTCDNVCLICNRLNISHLSLAWEPIQTASDHQYTFFYHPPPEIISKGYATHIKMMDWDRFSILYEDEGSFIRLQEVINTWRNDLSPIHFKKLYPDDDRDNKETLKYIFKVARLSYHILDCKSENIIKYMKEIQQIGQDTVYQSILLTSLDAYTVDLRSLDINANVTTWHLTGPLNDDLWKEMGIYTRDPKKLDTALTVDALQHLENSIKVMLSADFEDENPPALCYLNTKEGAAWSKGTALRDALLQTATKGKFTGNIQFGEDGKRINFLLHYSILNNQSVFEHAGVWNSTTDTIETEYKSVPLVKSNVLLKVLTKEGKPYYTAGDNETEHSGYVVDLMEEIFKNIKAQGHDFKYVIELAPGNSVGNPIEGSRRWDGLIGELMEHKAAMGICDLTITSERNSVVDFSIPFMTLGISMLFQVSPPPEPNMFSFVGPLSTDVWLYLAVVYIFVSLILLICARMSQDDWVNPHPCNRNPENLENIWSLYNCMWLTMGSIMTQGCDILPRGYGSRWIAGMWYFFALIVTASYTANMSTFISNSRRSNNIENVKDLSEQTEVSYGAMRNGSTYKFFEASNDTVHQKIWQVMSSANPTVFTDTNEEGKERVVQSKDGKYVFFMESTTIEYYIKQDCRLKMVGPKLDSKDYGIALPKNSPYRFYLNNAILTLQEKGILQKLKEKWWAKEKDSPKQKCQVETEEKKKADSSGSLQMKNTSGIFLVLGVGGILGFIIAVIGFLLHAHDICVKERITFKEALASEWRASLNPMALNKPAAPPRSAPPSTKSPSPLRERSQSRAVSVLRAAQSFINFNDIY